MADNNGTSSGQSKIALRVTDAELSKATLKSLDDGSYVKFQFNPKEISFSTRVTLSKAKGARAEESGLPKVSYGNLEANTISLKNIYFDTYEDRDNVLEKYIKTLRNFAKFVSLQEQRTHILKLIWGDYMYIEKCFIESLDYRFTMFLPNGRPVRAIVDNLTLVETDENP